MRFARVRLFAAAVVLAALGYLGFRGAGPAPPLGGFLDPARGVWALARTAEPPDRSAGRIPGLTAPVRVLVDDRGVPHIFAESEEDAWRAQGYVVARDRLFQMELQTRAAAGTLAELVGSRALEADRSDRLRGFPWAAERTFASLDSTRLLARAVSAYAAGVNAWIDQLDATQLPLEYRLLNARPARWRPIDTFYLFLQMAFTLAWEDETLVRQEARGLVGELAAEALFPLNSPIQEPIEPNGQRAPRYDFRSFPPPGAPDTLLLRTVADRRAERLALAREGPLGAHHAPLAGQAGSNNWAVAPRRTSAGYALLAGDPHLELSLPSVWYEIHLNVPGRLDVAGVTFAGAPGVIIGFNRELAWSFTNTGADVRDHYRETLDDPARPTRYRVDGAWRPLEARIEVVRGRRGEVLATDTVFFTHRGPLVREGPSGLSLRWTPFELLAPGEEFLRLDRAASVSQWLDEWKEYVAAAQNGVVASRTGEIAIRSTGRFPLRPGTGRGDEIRDGTTAASDWTGFVELERYPFARDPAQGYLASANQQPVDPLTNPRYFGANWYSPWRALHLNRLLRADSALTPEAMRRLQTDPGSARADAFVPLLLAAASALQRAGQADTLVICAAGLLAEWDRRYTRDNRRAVLFEQVMSALPALVWDELMHPLARSDSAARPIVVPEEAVLLALAADSTSLWWDDTRTAARESRDAILGQALRRALLAALLEHGASDGPGWLWENAHHANLYHLLRFPVLSALDLPVTGGVATLNPSPGRGIHGASWRMVVELGPEVRAWAIYPGGQSGNPASARYLDRLPGWQAGRLDSVLFPRRPGELPSARVRSELLLEGVAR